MKEFYGNSVYNLVTRAFPTEPWRVWLFASPKPFWWRDPAVFRQYFDDLGTTIGIKQPSDWYKVTGATLKRTKGAKQMSQVIRDSGGFVGSALQKAYPEHEWEVWRFKAPPPQRWWADPHNRRRYFDWLSKKIKISTMEDWYSVDRAVLIKHKGGPLLLLPKFFTPNVIMEAYPEHEWIPWKFSMVEKGFWQEKRNVSRYFTWLAPLLGIRELADWYSVTTPAFRSHRGSSLMKLYHESVPALVMETFPNHKWLPWKFSSVSNGFWADRNNQRWYLDWLKEEKGFKSMDDFYALTGEDLEKTGGVHLIKQFSRSVAVALMEVYPEHEWHVWLFKTLPRVIPNNIQTEAMNVVKSLATQLGITLPQAEDSTALGSRLMNAWYRVSAAQIPHRFQKSSGGLPNLLRRAFPNHVWVEELFAVNKRLTSQLKLHALLSKHLGTSGEEHVRLKTPRQEGAEAPESRWRRHQTSEIDLFFKEFNLAIEYQGVQHYFDRFVYGEVEDRGEVDEMKALDCATQKISLVEVPFWWDEQLPSVIQALRQIRADIRVV